jgi:hypothetical protein
MQRGCVALHEANGGHTRYWLIHSHTLKKSYLCSNRRISVFPVMLNP